MKKTNLTKNQNNNIEEVINMNEKYIYRIFVKTYYYGGTINDPGNFYLKDYYHNHYTCKDEYFILNFNSYEEAEKYLFTEFGNLHIYLSNPEKFIYSCDYKLEYSEYGCRDFQIRKFKKKSHSLV